MSVEPINGLRDDTLAKLEALLFAAEQPMTIRRLATLLESPAVAEVQRGVKELNAAYDQDGSAFRIVETAGGVHLLTRPEVSSSLSEWRQSQESLPLAPAALQSLAVIAYRQPVTRADIEAIRGVPIADALKQLLDGGWVKVVGREESLGRPQLYGTTRAFLQEFGVRNLDELPSLDPPPEAVIDGNGIQHE